jgi:hypothetical protein
VPDPFDHVAMKTCYTAYLEQRGHRPAPWVREQRGRYCTKCKACGAEVLIDYIRATEWGPLVGYRAITAPPGLMTAIDYGDYAHDAPDELVTCTKRNWLARRMTG